ncbi:Gti1/Pac2 family-domain-containing protein [Hypoxylon sp. FL1284]|nr:Gti1/Pac2 family-domain-containing protein [Hypoxylon sp. FL1284]
MANNHSKISPEDASPGLVQPTFYGFVQNCMDALILFEACLTGQLQHVSRRPHDRERPELIASGNVFVYEEKSSGIKRWTDGVSWSPSRILGNFLIYRELDQPFQPGEKKRAIRRPRAGGAGANARSRTSHSTSPSHQNLTQAPVAATRTSTSPRVSAGNQRALVGSLVDSYQFKRGGLVKKSFAIRYHGVSHHLVSYYCLDDIESGRLRSPAAMMELRNILPRNELLYNPSLRAPIDDHELAVATSSDRGVALQSRDTNLSAYGTTNSAGVQPQQAYPHGTTDAQELSFSPPQNFRMPNWQNNTFDAAGAPANPNAQYGLAQLPTTTMTASTMAASTSGGGYTMGPAGGALLNNHGPPRVMYHGTQTNASPVVDLNNLQAISYRGSHSNTMAGPYNSPQTTSHDAPAMGYASSPVGNHGAMTGSYTSPLTANHNVPAGTYTNGQIGNQNAMTGNHTTMAGPYNSPQTGSYNPLTGTYTSPQIGNNGLAITNEMLNATADPLFGSFSSQH